LEDMKMRRFEGLSRTPEVARGSHDLLSREVLQILVQASGNISRESRKTDASELQQTLFTTFTTQNSHLANPRNLFPHQQESYVERKERVDQA
jgi:hypothetical protein